MSPARAKFYLTPEMLQRFDRDRNKKRRAMPRHFDRDKKGNAMPLQSIRAVFMRGGTSKAITTKAESAFTGVYADQAWPADPTPASVYSWRVCGEFYFHSHQDVLAKSLMLCAHDTIRTCHLCLRRATGAMQLAFGIALSINRKNRVLRVPDLSPLGFTRSGLVAGLRCAGRSIDKIEIGRTS